MTALGDLRRTAIDRGLKVARLPLDVATNLLPNDRGPRNAATLVIDRVDATVRASIGHVLHDDELLDDAQRRRVAAAERGRAAQLRHAADAKRQQVEEELADELQSAADLRERAARDERERKEHADAQAARRQTRARASARAQKQSVGEAARERLEAQDIEAKRRRLEALDQQTRALERDDDALTAIDEAQRLRDAATAVKKSRKAKGESDQG